MLDLSNIREFLSYDPETGVFRWIKRATFHRHIVGGDAGSVNARGWRVIKFGGKIIRAGRLAWFFVHGEMPPDNMYIDHINGRRDDNRIANLRLATPHQSARNRGSQKETSSRFKGVCFIPHARKWQAAIKCFGRPRHLGWFDTEELAAMAYDQAAATHFHDFARLNFSKPSP